MKHLLRLILAVVVAAVVLAVVYPAVRAQQTAPGQNQATDPTGLAGVLDQTTVERGELTVTVGATGPVKPNRSVDLLFETSAPVAEILVDEGTAVQAGAVLARLDMGELEEVIQDAQVALQAQQVAYEGLIAPPREEDIAAAEAAVNAALAQSGAAARGADAEAIEIARLRTELARNQLWQSQLQRDDRMELPVEFRGGPGGTQTQDILLQSGLEQAEYQISISEAEYANVTNQPPDYAGLGSAAAQLAQAQVALDRLLDGASEIELRQAEIRIQQAELSLRQAEATLDNAVLRAPFDGVIARNNLVVGELPPAGNAAMVLLDASEYYVEVAVDETDIAYVLVGQPAELTFDALDTDLTGSVSRVALTPTAQGQLVTYTVRVALDDSDVPVRPGMNATATIITDHLQGVLTLPNRFIRIDRDSGQAFATTISIEGQFIEVPIEMGLRNDTDTQIVGGLREGDPVVLLPRDSFNPFGG